METINSTNSTGLDSWNTHDTSSKTLGKFVTDRLQGLDGVEL